MVLASKCVSTGLCPQRRISSLRSQLSRLEPDSSVPYLRRVACSMPAVGEESVYV